MREVLLCALAIGCVEGVAAAGALDQPAFTATPQELLAAARAVTPGDAPVVILRRDVRVSFDARGRATETYRTIFVVEQASAAKSWRTLEVAWSASYEEQPAVRARVVGPGGQVAVLDPGRVTDAPVATGSRSAYSDQRVLDAQLPALAVGAVVEEMSTIHDRAPLLPAGVAEHLAVVSEEPVAYATVMIDAPDGLPVRVVPRGFATPPVIRRTSAGGRTTWRYAAGPWPAAVPRPDGVPPEIATWPSIGVSTGASWAAVAAGYRGIVEARIAEGPVKLPAEARGATPRETVARTVAWLHHGVRYTGVDVAEAELAPWPPAATMKRGFGDDVDEATLLVALLRAAGIHADLALISAGEGLGIDPALPGLGELDHAIVRAEVAGAPLWIDPTRDALPAGQLPSADQGRLALVIAPGTQKLVATPVASAADNLVREVRTYHVAEQTGARVTEVTTEHGAYADNLRRWIRDTDHDELVKNLTGYVTNIYDGKLVRFAGTEPSGPSRPFALTIEAADARRVFTERKQIDAYLRRSDTFVHVPDLLKARGADHDAEVASRQWDYVWSTPASTRSRTGSSCRSATRRRA
jgi:hypothetical protein